ncbi:MAG: hypothetical protein ACLTYN_03520 [Dysosmobacter welbionis]
MAKSWWKASRWMRIPPSGRRLDHLCRCQPIYEGRRAAAAGPQCDRRAGSPDYEEATLGEIYETILKELQSAGSAGEFYTPGRSPTLWPG